jgi:hypothetical protein
VERIATYVPPGACIDAPDYSRTQVASLEQYGRWRVHARASESGTCPILLRQEPSDQPLAAPAGWSVSARVRRPTDRDEVTAVLRRLP